MPIDPYAPESLFGDESPEAAPARSKSDGWKEVAPILAMIPLVLRKSGQQGLAHFLAAYQQTKQQRDRQAQGDQRQQAMDARQREQQMFSRQIQQQQVDTSRDVGQRTYINQMLSDMQKIDDPNGIDTLAQRYRQLAPQWLDRDVFDRVVAPEMTAAQQRQAAAAERKRLAEEKAAADRDQAWAEKIALRIEKGDVPKGVVSMTAPSGKTYTQEQVLKVGLGYDTGGQTFTPPEKADEGKTETERGANLLNAIAQAEARGDTEKAAELKAKYARRIQARKDFGQAGDRPRQGSGGGGSAPDANVEAIADAIVQGLQPPTMTGLYGKTAAVRAALARRGYNLTNATLDYDATKRHFATLNGPQQTRLRQAANTAMHSLDVVEELSNKWQGGAFPLLNKGRLAAATNGVLGPEAQVLATQLTAVITDVTSELGNVYMGGNSPTDHALQLAAKNLSEDWSLPQLKAALDLARTNLTIRQNAIRNSGTISQSGGYGQGKPPKRYDMNGNLLSE